MPKTTSLRNKDLIARAKHIARAEAAAGRRPNLEQLADLVRAAQPLHFYQNYDHASRMLHIIERHGEDALGAGTESRALWLDMYRQVKEVMELRKRLNFSQALTHVLIFRRPERFYISRDTARRIISPHFAAVLTENSPGRA